MARTTSRSSRAKKPVESLTDALPAALFEAADRIPEDALMLAVQLVQEGRYAETAEAVAVEQKKRAA